MDTISQIIIALLGIIFFFNIYIIKYILRKKGYQNDEYFRPIKYIKDFIHFIQNNSGGAKNQIYKSFLIFVFVEYLAFIIACLVFGIKLLNLS